MLLFTGAEYMILKSKVNDSLTEFNLYKTNDNYIKKLYYVNCDNRIINTSNNYNNTRKNNELLEYYVCNNNILPNILPIDNICINNERINLNNVFCLIYELNNATISNITLNTVNEYKEEYEEFINTFITREHYLSTSYYVLIIFGSTGAIIYLMMIMNLTFKIVEKLKRRRNGRVHQQQIQEDRHNEHVVNIQNRIIFNNLLPIRNNVRIVELASVNVVIDTYPLQNNYINNNFDIIVSEVINDECNICYNEKEVYLLKCCKETKTICKDCINNLSTSGYFTEGKICPFCKNVIEFK